MFLWEKIEKILKEKNTTAYQVAKKANVNVSMLYSLKNGDKKDISFMNMCKIADALEVSLDEFR